MLKLNVWAKLLFTKNLVEVMQRMASVTPKELQVWEHDLDVIVSTSCRTFEIRYRPYGDAGFVHSIEVEYANHKEVYDPESCVVHHIDNMETVVAQLNKYFGLLES